MVVLSQRWRGGGAAVDVDVHRGGVADVAAVRFNGDSAVVVVEAIAVKAKNSEATAPTVFEVVFLRPVLQSVRT